MNDEAQATKRRDKRSLVIRCIRVHNMSLNVKLYKYIKIMGLKVRRRMRVSV